jgi:hypothetical protein
MSKSALKQKIKAMDHLLSMLILGAQSQEREQHAESCRESEKLQKERQSLEEELDKVLNGNNASNAGES